MRPFLSRRTVARLFFIIGILSMLIGSLIIAGLTDNSPRALLKFFVFLMILGVGCSAAAAILVKSPLYLFFSVYSLQAGVFLFLSGYHFIPITFVQAWPLLAVFTGISIIPAGWYLQGSIKGRYLVYSLAFFILGAILLVFSLDLVPFSLAQFVKDWWPLLIVLWGLLLMFVSRKANNTDNKR